MSKDVRFSAWKDCPECRSRRFTWNPREQVGQCHDCGFETGEEE